VSVAPSIEVPKVGGRRGADGQSDSVTRGHQLGNRRVRHGQLDRDLITSDLGDLGLAIADTKRDALTHAQAARRRKYTLVHVDRAREDVKRTPGDRRGDDLVETSAESSVVLVTHRFRVCGRPAVHLVCGFAQRVVVEIEQSDEMNAVHVSTLTLKGAEFTESKQQEYSQLNFECKV